jgi:hypothetical protein
MCPALYWIGPIYSQKKRRIYMSFCIGQEFWNGQCRVLDFYEWTNAGRTYIHTHAHMSKRRIDEGPFPLFGTPWGDNLVDGMLKNLYIVATVSTTNFLPVYASPRALYTSSFSSLLFLSVLFCFVRSGDDLKSFPWCNNYSTVYGATKSTSSFQWHVL